MISPLEQLPNTYRPFFGKFSSLTLAQKALIKPILDEQDVVLKAGTGSGKTEGVLAPVTERLITSSDYFTVVYIVPTRALALDMNRRIHPIYKQLGLKSGYRTGDGKTLRDGKPNLLILTPESLDVLLGSQNSDNKDFLKHLRVMVIDEVHTFLNEERGYQLAFLRRRLEMQSLGVVQTITLSATISDSKEITSFFNLKNVFYYEQPATRRLQPFWVHLDDDEFVSFFDDLHIHSKCQKLLVFANSRKKCEKIFDLLSQDGVFSQNVLLHYSNLSTKERRFIESSFRNNKKSVCIATSTLEMGIDIGDVDGVVLIGPPSSTMAFLQRIGRGNRRQQYINFWGVCQGAYPERQLVRFLALYELAKENQVEKVYLKDKYSVLFQQILSCLYAKKLVSQNSLEVLFHEHKEGCHSIFQEMVSKNWLKSTKNPGLFSAGWRFMRALQRQEIWSNFPPSDEEYDVILEEEKIAVLPFSSVSKLEIGDLIQLTGRVLKILKIEEKQAHREVWVEESDNAADKDLFWAGLGIPTSYEVAKKMGEVISEKKDFQGLLNRSKQLMEKARKFVDRAVYCSNGILTYRLGNGLYRYETFLGSTGNFILHHIIKDQLTSKDLSVNFDEFGIECSDRISFESLKFPYTISLFQEWVSSHLQILREAFSWNSWLRWLPKEHQLKEITSDLLDIRILEQFERYQKMPTLNVPSEYFDESKQVVTQCVPLKGEVWSLEKEKQEWGRLSFPEIPTENLNLHRSLTATQIQGYVTQKLCPRWARFQNLNYNIESHPRFHDNDKEIQSRKQESISFKGKVIDELKKSKDLHFETEKYTWKEAIKEVIVRERPLFIAEAKLGMNQYLKGSPDLIYLKHEGSHICVEVWDIKNGYTFTYAQKWRIAFYAYLLEFLLKEESFSLPIKVSDLGGLVYRHIDEEKLFEKTPFLLAHYRSLMPRLVHQWELDSLQSSSVQKYSMDSSCTSCRYFSYCYQETIYKESLPVENQAIVSLDIESNDFPKNSKQWFFIHYDRESVRWQCWENNETVRDTSFNLKEYKNWSTFQEAVTVQLHKEWQQSIDQRKNPHCLVYELSDWYFFQKAFQATPLKSLWAMHSCWTSIQTVLKKHFIWPISGQLTATQVARCLGLVSDSRIPSSLYHRESPSEISFDLYREIWSFCLSKVKSRRTVSFDCTTMRSVPLVNAYLAMQRREWEHRNHEILEFQKNPLPKRVENFRAIGPLTFLGVIFDGKQKCYNFSINEESVISKFRVGDFLKLSPVESFEIQDGYSVALETYSLEAKTLSVRPLSQKINLSKNQLYVLDEDATDWNAPKIEKVLNLLKDPKFRPELIEMLHGNGKTFTDFQWIKQWYSLNSQYAGLNPLQVKALELAFLKNIGLIEGPPGTGKTHLLVWTLIALISHAKFLNCPIKILVTAQTHQAIDQILKKVAKTLLSTNICKVSLWKYGRYDYSQFPKLGIQQMLDDRHLNQDTSLILGATGYGVYQLLDGKNFPKVFDWVVFDESSQVLPSYALLSLIFGKGKALFYGDTQQLPPVIIGHYENSSLASHSILQELISKFSSQHRVRLNETYRMTDDICKFSSSHWYNNELHTAESKKNQRLELYNYPLFQDILDDYLDPSKAMVVVQLDHEGCRQSSQEEAHWIVKAVKRLIENYSVSIDEIGIISPHRLQNNTILAALKEAMPFTLRLPKIDTVERMQGLEFDIVIFSATVSEKEVIHSAFLKDYRRFNVSLTRARKKFVFVSSALFFETFPMTEKELIAHFPFEELFALSNLPTNFNRILLDG